MSKRTLLPLLMAASIGLGTLAAQAQTYPSRPIKVVVPFAAGGPLDLVARTLSDKLSARLKQPFVIENRVGAGGNLGTEVVAKAPPDGYTLGVVLSGRGAELRDRGTPADGARHHADRQSRALQ